MCIIANNIICIITVRGITASQACFHFCVLILEMKLQSCKQHRNYTREVKYVPNIQHSKFAGLKRIAVKLHLPVVEYYDLFGFSHPQQCNQVQAK